MTIGLTRNYNGLSRLSLLYVVYCYAHKLTSTYRITSILHQHQQLQEQLQLTQPLL